MLPTNDKNNLETSAIFVDFGHMHTRHDGSRSFVVGSGIEAVVSKNPNIVATLSLTNPEKPKVMLSIGGADSGEILWDEVILKDGETNRQVIVFAYWDDETSEDNSIDNIDIPDSTSDKERELVSQRITYIEVAHEATPRTFKGRKCETCGKNFKYAAIPSEWEKCTCRWYEKMANLIHYAFRELRSGYKEIPLFLKETWSIIMGKAKW